MTGDGKPCTDADVHRKIVRLLSRHSTDKRGSLDSLADGDALNPPRGDCLSAHMRMALDSVVVTRYRRSSWLSGIVSAICARRSDGWWANS